MIALEKITENGELIEFWKESPHFIVLEVNKEGFEQSKYPLLSGIDSYQNTYFNTIQIPCLVKELKDLKEEVFVGRETKELTDDLIDFLKTVDTHEYAKFIGD